MKTLRCTKTNQSIDLTTSIATSGEGEVWQTNRPGTLAKIYHDPTADHIAKLRVMIAHPPSDPNQHQQHISYAWPQSLLEEQGRPVGFLMPEIKDGRELLNIYTPKLRKRNHLEIDWRFLHVTAMNVAALIARLHAEGYVLGDIKPQNILVNSRALPSIIDTDSFQVRDPETGVLHHCPVGSPEFTPPELMGKDLATTEQTVAHDAFRLGVLIYLLLFGSPPFQGDWVGPGDRPEPNEWIIQGLWPYGESGLVRVSRNTIPLDIVHSSLKALFLQCFNEGNVIPERRPKADIWKTTLELGINNLVQCGHTDEHIYNQSYGHCYWCERRDNLGIDIFKSPSLIHQRLTNSNSVLAPKITQSKNNNHGHLGSIQHSTISKTSNYTFKNFRNKINYFKSESLKKLKLCAKYLSPILSSLKNNIVNKLSIYKTVSAIIVITTILAAANSLLTKDIKAQRVDSFNIALQEWSIEIPQSSVPELRESGFSSEHARVLQQQSKEVSEDQASSHQQTDIQDTGETRAYQSSLDSIPEESESSPQDIQNDVNSEHKNDDVGRANRSSCNWFCESEIEAFTEAIRVNPDDAEAHIKRGDIYNQLGDYEAAVSDYSEVIRIKPNNFYAYLWRGNAKYDLGEYEAAIADYDEVIRLDPRGTFGTFKNQAYNNRGAAKYELGQYEAAITDYDEALNGLSGFILAYANRGSAKYELGQYEAAIRDYDEAILMHLRNPAVYTERGNAKANLGQMESANRDWEEAERLRNTKVSSQATYEDYHQAIGRIKRPFIPHFY